MVGTLAHRIAAEILHPGAPPDPEAVRSRTRELLEDFLPKIAAPLLAPGSARDLAEIRRIVPEALAEIARLLGEQRLEIVGVEAPYEVADALRPGVGIAGVIDLVVQDRGRKAVVDLKWQRSDKRRREEIRDGRAIQLALYHALVADAKKPATAGYFLLRQRQLLMPEADVIGTLTGLPGKPLDDTWRDIGDSTRQLASELEQGNVRATGHLKSQERPPLPLSVPVTCAYCDYQALCGGEART
jgi:hypothetical protein